LHAADLQSLGLKIATPSALDRKPSHLASALRCFHLLKWSIEVKDHRSAELLHAIENLINAKLFDAIGRPDGLARLVGHRTSGVAASHIRYAERDLERTIGRCLLQPSALSHSEGNSL
jgi:hypothetical protein